MTSKEIISKLEYDIYILGKPSAAHELGLRYLKGEEIPKNLQKGFKYIQHAAEAGCAEAYYDLGVCYALGEGTEADETEAQAWFDKAVASGDYEAANNIGLYYMSRPDADSKKKGFELFRKAAEAGLAEAQCNLAFACLQKGNTEESKKWFTKAIDQGHARSLYGLGLQYVTSSDNKLFEKGIALIEKAAKAGCPEALSFLENAFAKAAGENHQHN